MSNPASSPRVTTGEILRLGLWFGLITGLGAAGLTGIKKFLLDQVTLITPQIVWTAPLTFVVLALPVSGLLILLVRLAPRRIGLGTAVFVLAAAGAATGLLTWSAELHDAAVAVLALGIGVQFARIAEKRPAPFFRFVRVTTLVMLGLVVLLTAAINLGGRVREARAIASLPETDAGAPNVLLIILDTVRARNLGLYGYPRPTTPRLEQFANTGITFDHALAPSPWTLPTHASMFTGRPAHELSAGWTEPLDDAEPTIAEYLGARGYRTGGVTGNFFYGNSEWGLARGFHYYKDYDVSLGHGLLSTFPGLRFVKWLENAGVEEHFWFHRINGRRIAPDVRRDLLRWVERDTDRPWFAFVNFYDAHDPYVAPDRFVEKIQAAPPAPGPPERDRRGRLIQQTRPEQVARTLSRIDDYDAGIAYLDDEVGRMLDEFGDRGLLDNTLVIITSDHGEEFGEHGRHWHGETLYMPSLHVPLVVRLPDGALAGARVATPVSPTDVAATIVDVLGLADGSPFQGRSLARVANGTERSDIPVLAHLEIRDPADDADAVFRSVFLDGLHFIATDRGREELYAHPDDPFELDDLMEERRESVAVLRGLLSDLVPMPRVSGAAAR